MEGDTGTNRRGGRRGRGRGRAAAAKPRGRGRGRGRPKKMVIESDDDEQQIETSETVDNMVEIVDEPPTTDSFLGIADKELSVTKEFSIDDDISTLVPPTFSTLSTGPPQPMIELDWNHHYNPSAERVPSPNIHMCVSCLLPIRSYGRLIPCKHVFCYFCATKQGSKCSLCNDYVHRIEQAHLGSVHMCNHEGSRYGFDGCRRTYLSQRDLQAHINHRHKPRNAVSTSDGLGSGGGLDSFSSTKSIPVVHSSRSNLISIPMLQGGSSRAKAENSILAPSPPENTATTPTSTSTGPPRYDRKSSYSHYSRNNWQQFRQF